MRHSTASAEEGQDRLSSGQGRRICYAVLLSPFSEEHTTEYGRPIARLSTEGDGREEFRARNLQTSTGARQSDRLRASVLGRCKAGASSKSLMGRVGQGHNIRGKEDQKGVV